MQSGRTDALLLEDIIFASTSLETFTAPLTKEEFLAHDMVRSACSWKLIVIGEAVKYLSVSLKIKYSLIPWEKIIKNRNYLAHSYDTVSWSVVWNTITEYAIPLRQEINKIFKEEFPE